MHIHAGACRDCKDCNSFLCVIIVILSVISFVRMRVVSSNVKLAGLFIFCVGTFYNDIVYARRQSITYNVRFVYYITVDRKIFTVKNFSPVA